MRYVAGLCLLAACGGSFTYGPDIKGASDVCNSHYGDNTEASNSCLADYLHFNRVTAGVDLDNIKSFCKDSYTAVVDQEACTTDLLNVLTHTVH